MQPTHPTVSPEVHALIQEAHQHVTRACNSDSIYYYQHVLTRATELKKHYPEYHRVLLYHLMIGGTLDFREHTIVDFPEPDSVLSFLKQTADRLSHRR